MKKIWILILICVVSTTGFAKSKTNKLPAKITPKGTAENANKVPLVAPEAASKEIEAPIAETVTSINVADEKFMSFRLNPVPLVFGALDTSLDFKVSDHWQVGPQLLLLNLKLLDIEFANQGGGIRGTWTYNEALTDSFFLQAAVGATRVSASVTTSSGRFTNSGNSIYYYGGAGYQWQWTNFNLGLGVNVAGASIRDMTIYDSNNQQVDSGTVPIRTGAFLEFGFAL